MVQKESVVNRLVELTKDQWRTAVDALETAAENCEDLIGADARHDAETLRNNMEQYNEALEALYKYKTESE